MRPDRCGTGRRLDELSDADRQVVDEFRRFLRGELDYDPATGGFVPLGDGVSRNRLYPKETQ